MLMDQSINLEKLAQSFSNEDLSAIDFVEKYLSLRRDFLDKKITLSSAAENLMENLFWPVEDFEPDPEIFDKADGHIEENEFRNRVRAILIFY
ncbi:hypothetical protein HNQ50_001134 [Silvimonas terrae]|uniref:Colicin D immunity protein domain-containing protein n=1 Tax=Silvimonas terrae TaxID=300266 RepID=A0A840RDM6_9NEIS|nr:colicin immunity domain-containing protein [Silvimonas terrae]MBB5190412.1 hypothetical protein [Silvimonas terrae]